MTAKDKFLTTEDLKYIFNELRKASVKWNGRKEVMNNCRQKVFQKRTKDGNAVYKFHWQCASCLNWFKNQKDLEVDHIFEIGGITEFSGDWNETIAKVFPRPVEKYLQALCHVCHSKKTLKYMAASHKYKRRK